MTATARPAAALALAACVGLAACVALERGAPAPAPAPGVGRIPPAAPPPPPMPERTGRLRAAPERLEFEAVEVGASAELGLDLVNEGWGSLWIREVAVADSRTFAITRDGCSRRTLRPREDCRVTVRFTPREAGRVSGILRVRSNDPGRPDRDLLVTASGVAPRRPAAVLRPARLDFGPVPAGAERILEAEVANAGGAPLRVRASSAAGRGFRVVTDLCSRGALAPGATCRIAVRFSGPGPGRYEGELRVRTDDPERRELAAGLAAEAVAARPRCPQQRLEPLRGERGGERELVLTGKLPRNGCLTYAVRLREEGRLLACVPAGYDFSARGFEAVDASACGGDERRPGRAYRSGWIEEGADLDDLTITRGDRGAGEFTVLLRFRPRRDERGGGRGEGD